MARKIVSFLLVLVMVLGMIPATVMTANAASDTIIGVSFEAEGYKNPGNGYYPANYSIIAELDSGETGNYSYGSGPLFLDEAQKNQLKTEPELNETYYFSLWIWNSGLDQNITQANSSIYIDGFHNGRVLSAETKDDGDIEIFCSITYGALTAGVKAVATGVAYDSEKGAYTPQFSTLKCVSPAGKALEPVKVPASNGGYYSYYGAKAGCLYKTINGITCSNPLTTEPRVGETYYGYLLLDSIDGNLHIEDKLVDIYIPGYVVKFIDSYGSDMGFTSQIVYSVTKQKEASVYVGGVGMTDGDYLAVGATKPTTTKPGGGYAYYKNGTLTLRNYSYEGKGFRYNQNWEYYAAIYATKDLTIDLVGSNTLVQTANNGDAVYVAGASLTVGGTGRLTSTDDYYGFYASENITINGGTIASTSYYSGIYSYSGNITINGGDIALSGHYGLFSDDGAVVINGGKVTAVGSRRAIDFVNDFAVADGMKIQAATAENGTLGAYVAANHDTYKKIVISELEIYVGGVGMCDGDYLAVGAAQTTTTKPSGGYAYYQDGKLTLNNYSYEGEGYKYSYFSAVIYAVKDLQITLTGTNTLTQTADDSETVYVDGASLTISGTGSLTNTDNGYGLYADGDITINSGTITSTGRFRGMRSDDGDIIINGGNITAYGSLGIYAEGDICVHAGKLTAMGKQCAIECGGSFEVSNGMKLQASTTLDGALGAYVASKHDSYLKIVVTEPNVYVGGIGLFDGEYLAAGATETTTSKPYGGYAYFKNGTLTLNNYSHMGEGFCYHEGYGYCAIVYTRRDLAIDLVGSNTLAQTADDSESVYVDGASLTIGGTGSLNSSDYGYGLCADGDITINGGTIVSDGYYQGIRSEYGNITINGGTITARGKAGIDAYWGAVIINGGKVTAVGEYNAIEYGDEFVVANGMKIQAATTEDGALGEYVAAYHDSYKKIVISPAKLATPAITKLENAANGIKLTWGKVTGAERYRVYVKTSTGWKNLGSTTGNTYTYTAAESGKTYTFTIRCVNADNTAFTSDFNATGWKQTFVGVPSVTKLESAANGIKLTWGAVPGAAKYRVFVKTSSGWATLGDTTGTTYTYTAAKDGLTYTFTVRCLSADGKSFTSAYNATGWKHTYNSAPVVTKLESTTSGIKLTWDAFSGAGKYRVYAKTSTGWVKLADTASTTYTYTGAKAGLTYIFTVRAMNAEATAFVSSYNTTGWSHEFNPTPAITKLESTTSGIKLTWDKINGAGKYRVYVKTSTGWVKLADTASNSYTYTGAKAGLTYIFTVRAMNAEATAFVSAYNATGWSHKFNPTPTVTKLESATNGIKLTWGAINGAGKYRVYVKTSTGWVKLADTASNSYTYTGAKAGLTYIFTVRAMNAEATAFVSAYNTTGWKHTFSPAPAATVANVANGIQISWGAINGAAKYRVFVKTSTGWTKLADTTSTSYTWTGAKSGQTYTFTVRCLSADGTAYTSSYNATGWSIKRN